VPGEKSGGGQPDKAAADDQNVGLDHHARPGFRANRSFLTDCGPPGKPAFPFSPHALKPRNPLGPASIMRRGGRVVECTALEMRHTGNRIGGSNPSLSAKFEHDHAYSRGSIQAIRQSGRSVSVGGDPTASQAQLDFGVRAACAGFRISRLSSVFQIFRCPAALLTNKSGRL
jgi:hypothetical protein